MRPIEVWDVYGIPHWRRFRARFRVRGHALFGYGRTPEKAVAKLKSEVRKAMPELRKLLTRKHKVMG